MIVKAIQEGRPPDVILSMDTGIEHDDTYCISRWYAEHVWAPAGIEYVMLTPWDNPEYYDPRIAGRSLLQFCREQQIVPLASAKWCSADWKGRVGDRWMKARGATECWLGFTAEEERRVIRRGCEMDEPDYEDVVLPGLDAPLPEKRGDGKPWIVRAPLWEDDVYRRECAIGLQSLGYPVPDKSGCIICPFNWKRLLSAARAGDPEALEGIQICIELEEAATAKRVAKGGRPVGITPMGTRIKDLWERPGLDLGEIDYKPYRPCECAV
jgi:hypothetical protein